MVNAYHACHAYCNFMRQHPSSGRMWKAHSVSREFRESAVAERLRNQASNQKVAGSCEIDVVSLGKALYPTCLGGMSLYLL